MIRFIGRHHYLFQLIPFHVIVNRMSEWKTPKSNGWLVLITTKWQFIATEFCDKFNIKVWLSWAVCTCLSLCLFVYSWPYCHITTTHVTVVQRQFTVWNNWSKLLPFLYISFMHSAHCTYTQTHRVYQMCELRLKMYFSIELIQGSWASSQRNNKYINVKMNITRDACERWAKNSRLAHVLIHK